MILTSAPNGAAGERSVSTEMHIDDSQYDYQEYLEEQRERRRMKDEYLESLAEQRRYEEHVAVMRDMALEELGAEIRYYVRRVGWLGYQLNAGGPVDEWPVRSRVDPQ